MHTPPGLEPGERQSRVASTEPRRTNTTKLAHISLHSEPVLLNQCPDLGDKGMDQSSSRGNTTLTMCRPSPPDAFKHGETKQTPQASQLARRRPHRGVIR